MAERLNAAERAFLAGHVVPRVDGDEPCIGKGHLFYPSAFWQSARRQIAEAKALCAQCRPERRQACLDGALERDERFGVWGGVSMFHLNNPQASGNRPVRKLSSPDEIVDPD